MKRKEAIRKWQEAIKRVGKSEEKKQNQGNNKKQ